MKKILTILALLVVIGLVFSLSRESTPEVVIPTLPAPEAPIAICYYRSEQTSSGLYDRAWIRLNFKGSNVTGEFNNYPAEKDSKVGRFEGQSMSESGTTSIKAIWNSFTEGLQAKEELIIVVSPEDGAMVTFGEMVKGANGVYVYKDTSAVVQKPIAEIDCAQLDEILAVEAYIKSSDIAVLTKEKPVLGGKFYTTAIVVDPTTDIAQIAYEDGHIAGKGTVSYSYESKKVRVNSFIKTP